MSITYKLAREDDLSAMRLVQSKSLYDLLVTRGRSDASAVPITDEPSSEMRLVLRTDPKLAWIAIEDGRPIGFSVGFVRGELWFLSDLFVLPEAQGKGVGAEITEMRPGSLGIGLAGMRQRAKEFGGMLRLTNANPGTLVEIVIPARSFVPQKEHAIA